jgi:ABC transporter
MLRSVVQIRTKQRPFIRARVAIQKSESGISESVLFEGTVRENIEIGRLEAPLDDVIEAAKKAHIHDAIMKLPDGYDTLVREQGNNFSAGQRQRLAIARAFLRDAPILILDEPTASLDVEAENDNIVFVINEATLSTAPIELHKNDSPDALAYDQTDHLVLVSVPGAPANPDESNVVDRKNQNLNLIDALTDKIIAIIPLGIDGQWGDDVGHVKFDPGLHRIFVVVQQLADPDSPKQNLLPPPGTAWLDEIDPLAHRVITRMKLPNTCITPHGMTIDTDQHIAFIACIDADPPGLYRVDLQTLRPFPERPWPLPLKPDMLVLDHPLHLLYVACGSGIALFKENGRSLQALGSYSYGVNTHSIAVNEETHEIYLPLVRVGGRPVLRIMRYNPAGVV